jgi:hypothetical protein
MVYGVAGDVLCFLSCVRYDVLGQLPLFDALIPVFPRFFCVFDRLGFY